MKIKRGVYWCLLIGWMLVIFFFSSQDGTSSSGLSNSIINLFPVRIEPLIIRKIAHFTEYFILGILSFNLCLEYTDATKKKMLQIWLFCVLYAISDEWHQGFVGGRNPAIFDVLIDSLGSLFGVLGVFVISKRCKHKIN